MQHLMDDLMFKGKKSIFVEVRKRKTMEAMELKQSLLVTINGIDERNTDLLQRVGTAVNSIMSHTAKKQEADGITPFVQGMKVGVRLPADFDMKDVRDKHLREKHA